MNNRRGKNSSSIPYARRLGVRFTLPLMAALLFFAGSMLGFGYFQAREQAVAGGTAHIRQLAAFAALQETYVRHWIEESMEPILRALEDAGPIRMHAYPTYRQRLEKAIMAAMPAERGQIDMRVYLEYRRNVWSGTRFIRGETPVHFLPDTDAIRHVLLAVADDAETWRMHVEEGASAVNALTARYYAPVFKRDSRGRRSRFGVLTADVSLAWLAGRIRSISTTPEAHIFFMDEAGVWTLPEPPFATAADAGSGADRGLSRLHSLMLSKQTGQTLVLWENTPHVAAYMPFSSGNLMLGMLIPEKELFGNLNRLFALFGIAGAAVFLFALLSLRRTAGLILRPVRDLSRYAEQLSAGDFSYRQAQGLPAPGTSVFFKKNAQRPDEPGRLKNAAAQLRAALRQRQRDLTVLAATRERLFGEIALAGKLQHTLRRGTAEPPKNFLLAADLRPAGPIANEALDSFVKDTDTLCCITASATAHGIPAALLLARVLPLLRELLLSGASPAEALENANIILHSYAPIDKTEMSPFVSVFIGLFSAHEGTFLWAGAGKNPPYRIVAGKAVALPWSGDLPLGVKQDAVYQNQRMTLTAGETLFVCGARLPAMLSPSGRAFGEERLLSLLEASPKPPDRLLEDIHAACRAHTQSETPSEDIALLAVRWLGGRRP